MKSLILQLEQLVIPSTWLILHKTLFPESRLRRLYTNIFFIIVVGEITYLFNDTYLERVTPIINVFISCTFHGMNTEKPKKEVIVESISSYMIVRLLWIVSVVVALLMLNVFNFPQYLWLECICNCSMQIMLCAIACRCVDSNKWGIFISRYSFTIITIAGSLFIISLSSINMPYVSQTRKFRIFSVVVIIGMVAIILTWMRSEYRWQQEKKDLSKQVEELVRRAHKYKSVIPAVERELRLAQRKMLDEHRWGTAKEIGAAIEEVAALREAMSADSMRELTEELSFESTGLILLDGQIHNEQKMAAEEGISFSCVVTSSAAVLIQQGVLSQFQLQQMVGDLVSNAFRAVSLQEGEDKRVLLILGETQDGYQIKICDTGLPFPPEILREFGKRGLTTGGTGHGLADLREIMAACGGSIRVEEYEEGAFTKAISLVMDGRATLCVHSAPTGIDYERSLARTPAGEGV